MKINLQFMRFSEITDHHEITKKVIETDKIIIDTKSKRYELNVAEAKDKNTYAFPNQFKKCLVITEKKGKKTIHGYFSMITISIDPNIKVLTITSIEEIFYKEDVEKYFKLKYKEDKKVEKIDVQTISVEDFLIQSRIQLMKEAKALFKRRKNVK